MDDARMFGRRLRGVLRSGEAWAILDADPATAGGTWSAGGCLLLAEALRAALGRGEVWIVTSPRRGPGDRVEHAALRLGGIFVDADGASSERVLLGRMTRREMIPSPSLRRLAQGDVARSSVAAPPASVAALAALLADRLGLPRPNGVPVTEREPRGARRAAVVILTDGVSDSHGVVTFVGRSSAGRRRIEGASEAFSYARKIADDLLRRGVANEVRISFAVERVEHRVEIRVRREDGSILVLPWHEAPRMNPSAGGAPPALRMKLTRDADGSHGIVAVRAGKQVGFLSWYYAHGRPDEVNLELIAVGGPRDAIGARRSGVATALYRRFRKEMLARRVRVVYTEPTWKGAYDLNLKVMGVPSYIGDNIREYHHPAARDLLPDDSPEDEHGVIEAGYWLQFRYDLPTRRGR